MGWRLPAQCPERPEANVSLLRPGCCVPAAVPAACVLRALDLLKARVLDAACLLPCLLPACCTGACLGAGSSLEVL